MTTCRDILIDAFSAVGAVAFGCDPTADEIDGGLAAMTTVMMDLHAARGPLREIDVAADFMASEDQRVRVAPGAQVVVTLPNSILCPSARPASDYEFVTQDSVCSTGSSGAADGVRSRPPKDGARIEIVGAAQAIYFYRSDTNAWIAVSPLAVDGPTPLNGRYDGALAALVGERLCDPMSVSPTPMLVRRIARGNAALMTRPQNARQTTRPTYL